MQSIKDYIESPMNQVVSHFGDLIVSGKITPKEASRIFNEAWKEAREEADRVNEELRPFLEAAGRAAGEELDKIAKRVLEARGVVPVP